MLGHVAPVTRLVTFVELDFADARQMSVSARHEAVLVDGRRVLLLDDRGWGASGPPNIWALTTAEDIADTPQYAGGEYTTSELADLFRVGRSTVYRALQRSRSRTRSGPTDVAR
jgi:hypothetical protein